MVGLPPRWHAESPFLPGMTGTADGWTSKAMDESHCVQNIRTGAGGQGLFVLAVLFSVDVVRGGGMRRFPVASKAAASRSRWVSL